MKMPFKQAVAETIQENPITVGIFFSLIGQGLDRFVFHLFPLFTILGFGAGWLAYLLSTNYTEKRQSG